MFSKSVRPTSVMSNDIVDNARAPQSPGKENDGTPSSSKLENEILYT